MNIKQKSIQAFTLVELMIVVIIIGILAAVTIVSYNAVQNNSISTGLQSDLNNVSDLLRVDQANSATGIFPTTLALANSGTGVPASPGTTYTYVYNNTNTPRTFCVTATRSGQRYSVTQEGKPFSGICPFVYFDPAIPTSYSGTGTTINDLSGNGNTGTFVGGVGFDPSNGGVMVFDGVNDYVSATTTALGIGHSFSLSAWIKTSITFAYEPGIISLGYSPVVVMQADGKVKAWWYASPSGYPAIVSTKKCNDGVFHHVALTYDGTTAKLYVDGALQSSMNSLIQNIYVNVFIGREYNNGSKLFNGQIGESRVYNASLTADEVNKSFNELRSRYGV